MTKTTSLLLFLSMFSNCGNNLDTLYQTDCKAQEFFRTIDSEYGNLTPCSTNVDVKKYVQICNNGTSSNMYTYKEYVKEGFTLINDEMYLRKVSGDIKKLPYCLQTLSNASIPATKYSDKDCVKSEEDLCVKN